MRNQLSTDQHFNKLIQFRQAVYQQGLTKRRDAQFELLDALLLSGPVRSFAELSLSPLFRRRWPSIYAAMQDGRQDAAWLKGYLGQQVPSQGAQLFALDGTAWPRPQAPTLPDRQYVHTATSAVDGGSIVVGHPYSMLAWVAQPRTSWALPVDIERIASCRNAVAVGVAQVQQLCQRRKPRRSPGLDIIVADGAYGNHRFLRPLRDQDCGVLVRLRRDRVLYGNPGDYQGRGRPPVHGPRFSFKEPDTWGEPAQRFQFQDLHWGQVDICYWSGLHARQAPDTPFGVLRVQVHLEQKRPPQALWLAWQGPAWSAELLWRYYQWRWPVEPSIRYRKQELEWTLPRFQSEPACERWTMLVSLAQWMLYLARPLVQDRPLPWQKVQRYGELARPPGLTPGRVRQGLGALFTQLGTPTVRPKTRGKALGWAKGRLRTRPARHPVVKKTAKKPQSPRKVA
jgi:hypothetical protein